MTKICIPLPIVLVVLSVLIARVDSGYLGCYKVKVELLKDEKIVGNVQTCLSICDKINFRFAALKDDRCYCDSEISENDKLSYTLCPIRCSKNKSQYCGGVDAMSYYVMNDFPKIINRTETSLTIEWDYIRRKHGITEYTIKADILKTYAKESFYSPPEFVVASDQDRYEISNLHPGTEYNITLTAKCGAEVCDSVSIKDETLIGIPDPEPLPLEIVNETKTTKTVRIEPTYNNNGPITSYRIVVEKLDQQLNQKFDENLLGSYYQSIDDGTNYYIAAEKQFTNASELFIIGDGKTYNGFHNPPLPENTHIHVSLGLVSERFDIVRIRYGPASHDHDTVEDFQNFKFADFEEGQNSIIALSVACVILACLLVFSVFTYFYLRYRTGHQRHRLPENHELQLPMGDVENHGFVKDDAQSSSRTLDFRSELNKIIDNLDRSQRYPRNAIRLNVNTILADGEFGEVVSGTLYTDSGAIESQVHVISDDMEKKSQYTFLQDFQNLIRVMPHEKFVNFLGVSASPDWFYLLFENKHTSLKNFLLDSRNNLVLHEGVILQIIYDISSAMEYLEVNRICHKNLSSHSIFLTENNQVKVQLFGPPVINVEEGRQIDLSRWKAPEVLVFQNCSIKSDIWSFAVVAWECCTLGATPYANITTQDLIPRIRNGLRPEQTQFIFNDIYQMFLNCWQLEPEDRISFEEISLSVRQMLTSPKHILNLSNNGNLQLPYYLPLLELKN